MYAAIRGNLEIVRVLVEKGADVNAVTKYKDDRGEDKGKNNETKTLITLRRSLYKDSDRNGWTALMYAAYSGHLDVVEFLLNKGAQVNAVDENGRTALFYAATGRKDTEVVNVLIAYGADTTILDVDGNSYLTYKKSYKYGDGDWRAFSVQSFSGYETWAAAITTGKIELPTLLLVNSQIHIKEFLLSHFEEYFQTHRKGKIVYRQAPEEGFIDFVVEGVKSEIIESKNFWERIQITLFYDEYGLEQENIEYVALKMRCVIDGRYGTGLGKPSSEGYIYDMEPDYAEQLQGYAVKLLMQLEKLLTKSGGGLV
jgi:hypothetical protein